LHSLEPGEESTLSLLFSDRRVLCEQRADVTKSAMSDKDSRVAQSFLLDGKSSPASGHDLLSPGGTGPRKKKKVSCHQ
jgi:hypothetical protein